MEGRVAPHLHRAAPLASTDLATPTSTLLSLYDINRGVWSTVEVAPIKSHSREKHSKLLLAL
jgi:hypothetical protein